ncbi:MAG TPA: beta-N-acetylhexosaminidase [Bryobacteraceae bacterium]|nr:beta-N-acetylhexosaminidase [Bryobacteraceae bacterium]
MHRLLFASVLIWPALVAGQIRVFPEPREIKPAEGSFAIAGARIALPAAATAADRYLARMLQSDLSDRYGLAIPTVPAGNLKPGDRAILMGVISNPGIRARATKLGLKTTAPEGYALDVSPNMVMVAGTDDRGAFYGLQTLRQLIAGRGESISAVRITDWPTASFRGIRLYLPGRENLGFFKRFVRDFMALYKFNHLVLEMNAAMRLDRHPELNAGWIEFGRDLNYSRRERSMGPRGEFQDSAHHDTGDFGVIEKEEVAEIVRWARLNHIEVTPEIPSLTHSYYLLTRHREMAENPKIQWPDTYCPNAPGVYKLLFEVYDEYIDVMKPSMVHIGHDEWRMPWGECERCKGKHFGDVFGEDVVKIHKYLTSRGVKTAMWGDHLIARLRGENGQPRKTATGFEYRTPGGLSAEQVKKWIPKDILILNWFWNEQHPGQGEVNDRDLEAWGFRQVYGNLEPSIQNWTERLKRRGVLGGAPSSWAATTELNFGKDLLGQFASSASMLWTGKPLDRRASSEGLQGLMPAIRRNLSGVELPSEHGDAVATLALPGGNAEAARQAMPQSEWKGGTVQSGRVTFKLADPVVVGVAGSKPAPWPGESAAIPVGEDPTSIIFLHALAKRAGNSMAYRTIYNFADSADLLGWYEVVYQDGYTVTVPIRYAVNIAEWKQPAHYCYEAASVNLGGAGTFYAYEWINPRWGKTVKEIRLKGTSGFVSARGGKIRDNGIILGAVSIVKKRPHTDPVITTAVPED